MPGIDIEAEGQTAGILEKLLQFCQKQGFKVAFEDLRSDLHGYAANGNISINSNKSNNTQINALLHEIAHALLHKNSSLTKEQKEIQAEAIAYVAARHTSEEKLILSKTKWLQREDLVEFGMEYRQILNEGFIIRLMKRTGKGSGWHISLNPRKLKEIYQIIQE